MPLTLDYSAPAAFRPPAPAHVLTVLLGSTLPLVVWLAVAIYAARVRLVVGHWPTYGDPDPKDVALPGEPWSGVLDLSGALPLAALAYLAARYVNRRVDARKRRRFAILISTCVGLVGIALLWTDPGGLLNWFAD